MSLSTAQLHLGDDKKNRSGHTPLISAVETENEAMAKTLLGAGADPGYYTTDYTPSTSLIRSLDMEIFTILLEKVSNPDRADRRRRTPLMHAMRNCHAIAGHLLARGARPDIEDKDGETTLSIAPQRAKETLVKLLLETIPVQEHVNAKGQDLLHFATRAT